jgi:hypothetical protein
MKRKHPPVETLQGLAMIVRSIEANQKDDPGYCEHVLRAIVNTENAKTERATAARDEAEQ